jgi:hypothetical protein
VKGAMAKSDVCAAWDHTCLSPAEAAALRLILRRYDEGDTSVDAESTRALNLLLERFRGDEEAS